MIHHIKRSDFWRAVQDARDILAPVEAALGEPVIELSAVSELAKCYCVVCDYRDDSTDSGEAIVAWYRRFEVRITFADEAITHECFHCEITSFDGTMVSEFDDDLISDVDARARNRIDAMHYTVNARPGRVKK
jgi:hypothetical protein